MASSTAGLTKFSEAMSSRPSSWRSVSFRMRAAISGSTWARVRVFSMARLLAEPRAARRPFGPRGAGDGRTGTVRGRAPGVRDSALFVDDQDADLTRIRQAIEALDRSLLALLRERQLLGEQAARAKIAAAVPLRDPVREAVVLRRARETAAELGLDTHQSEGLH